MLFIVLLILFSALYSWLLYFLINASPWFLFLFIPAGIILAALTIVLLLYLYLLLIGQHTKNNRPIKHIILRNACFLLIKFVHVKLEVEGFENVPKDTFVVYANHKSDLDPVFIYYVLNTRPISAVGKKSLFQNHFMKIFTKTFKAVPIDRENDREAAKSMVRAIKDVKDGLNMIIFPEGGIKTRDVEEMVNLRAGAYKLATKAGADILPVAIIGSSQISKLPYRKKKTVKIIFYKPIKKDEYDSLNSHEIGHKVEEIINQGVKDNE